MVNAQEWLDREYPLEKRNQITELSIYNRNLQGSLKLNGFVNLEELICFGNKLTELDLSDCKKLVRIGCGGNQLISLDWNNLNPQTLTELNIYDNNFQSDLSIFSKLINLKELIIGKNQFSGSLAPLVNLSRLKELNIEYAQIDSGLEHLPENLEKFYCSETQLVKELEIYGKPEYDYNSDNYFPLLQLWREFNDSIKLLDEHYPENEECKIGEENRGKKRADIKNLDILDIGKETKKINLENKGLWLKGFNSLEKLNCSGLHLSNLELRDCLNLTEFNCSNNKFKNLDFFKPFTNLKKIDLSDCPQIKGSLKSLEKLTKLEWLDISNTDIKEGLEYLPESCKDFYCELDYQHGSVAIAKELSKFSEEDKEANHTRYNLDKWRAERANNATVAAIPSERLFVIRNNINQFLKKWGAKEESGASELSKLRSPNAPDELWKDRWVVYGTQFIGRGAAVAGAVLTFQDQSAIGGGILAIYPFAELAISKLEESLKKKEDKWKEFLSDTDSFLDNFNELLGILKQVEIGRTGTVNEALGNLKGKIYDFLNDYDQDGNEEIEIKELTEERKRFSQELDKVDEIIETIKELEEEIISYRQGKVPIVRELLKKIKVQTSEELKWEKEIKEKLPQREINKVIWLSKKWIGEISLSELLVISNETINSNKKYFFDLFRLTVDFEYLSYNPSKLEIINDYKKKSFNSEEEAFKEALETVNIDLTQEQGERIENEARKMYKEEKVINKEIERERKKIIKEISRRFLKKYYRAETNTGQSSQKEILSLENPEKQKEVQEFIENQENNQKDTVIHLEENEQGGLTEKENLQEQSSLQAQIQIPPK